MIVLFTVVILISFVGVYYWGASDGRYLEAEETKELRAIYEKKIKALDNGEIEPSEAVEKELQSSIDSINSEEKK